MRTQKNHDNGEYLNQQCMNIKKANSKKFFVMIWFYSINLFLRAVLTSLLWQLAEEKNSSSWPLKVRGTPSCLQAM